MNLNDHSQFEHIAKYPILTVCEKFDAVLEPMRYKTFYHVKVTEDQLERINKSFHLGEKISGTEKETSIEKYEKLEDILHKIDEVVKDS